MCCKYSSFGRVQEIRTALKPRYILLTQTPAKTQIYNTKRIIIFPHLQNPKLIRCFSELLRNLL